MRISVKGLQPLEPRIIPLKRLSDCRQSRKHTEKHTRSIVKFQFEASSCYMSNCERENFWPTFDCQAAAERPCVLCESDTDTDTKLKTKIPRNTVVYLVFIEWEHRCFKCLSFSLPFEIDIKAKVQYLK